MNIDLTDREVYSILEQKFGEAHFRLFLSENEKGREIRTGRKLSEDKVCPTTNSIIIGIGKYVTIVPPKK